MIWLYIGVRVVANPLSNVLQKWLTNGGVPAAAVILATHLLLTIACLPCLVWCPPPAELSFWFNIGLCAVLAALGNTLLVRAVALSDLSVLGPINAYKSVVSLLPAMVLIGEIPTWRSLVGIALVVAGSYGLTDPAGPNASRGGGLIGLWRQPGVRLRLAALVVSATEAVFLKRALAVSNSAAATFAWWAALGAVAAAMFVAVQFRRSEFRRIASTCATAKTECLWVALTTGLMQYCTIAVFGKVHVGPALALFQTSTLLSVWLGHRLFGEPHVGRRLTGSLVMVAGATLIVVAA